MIKLLVFGNWSAEVLQAKPLDSNFRREKAGIQIRVEGPQLTFLNADLNTNTRHRRNEAEVLSEDVHFSHKRAVVEVSDVAEELRELGLQRLNDRLDGNGKQRDEGVALLNTTGGKHKRLTKLQPRRLNVAKLDPRKQRERMADLLSSGRLGER